MCSVDHSGELCLVGGERRKTLDSWYGKNYSGTKYQQEGEPKSFTEGRTIVQLEQCCSIMKVEA